MAENIDDITIAYEQDGKVLVKEIKKEILTRGGWTTIMFFYQELDRNSQEYKEPQVSIRRYQKRQGDFKLQSKFKISNKKQAIQIMDILKQWYEIS